MFPGENGYTYRIIVSSSSAHQESSVQSVHLVTVTSFHTPFNALIVILSPEASLPQMLTQSSSYSLLNFSSLYIYVSSDICQTYCTAPSHWRFSRLLPPQWLGFSSKSVWYSSLTKQHWNRFLSTNQVFLSQPINAPTHSFLKPWRTLHNTHSLPSRSCERSITCPRASNPQCGNHCPLFYQYLLLYLWLTSRWLYKHQCR